MTGPTRTRGRTGEHQPTRPAEAETGGAVYVDGVRRLAGVAIPGHQYDDLEIGLDEPDDAPELTRLARRPRRFERA